MPAICNSINHFNALQEKWGATTIDRFASFGNNLMDRFNSEFDCPGSAGVDAFSQGWREHPVTGQREFNWWNPPCLLLSRTILKIREDGARGSLVAPFWPSAPWWPSLRGLASHLEIQPAQETLFLPRGSQHGLQKPRWSIAVAHIQ